MPAICTFDAATGVIIVTGSGEFSSADYMAVQRAVESDPAIPTGSAVLFDVRAVTTFAISSHDVASFAHAHQSVDRRARRIAVVVAEPAGYSLARVYESARGDVHPPFKVFGAIEPAMTWLVER